MTITCSKWSFSAIRMARLSLENSCTLTCTTLLERASGSVEFSNIIEMRL